MRNLAHISIIFCLCLFLTHDIYSQQTISGNILAVEDSMPIIGAHILLKGAVVGTSNSPDGSFIFTTNSFPVNITFSHVSFQNKDIEIKKPSSNLTIQLSKKINTLPDVNVNSVPQRNIIKGKKIYVIDYGFEGDSILLLAYKNLNEIKASLILINSDGDTLSSAKLDDFDYIYADCFQNNHLISSRFASQIFVDDHNIRLLYKIKKDSFLNIFNSIEAYKNSKFYIHKNSASNQIVKKYIFDSKDSTFKIFRNFTDEAGLERLSDKSRLQSMDGYTSADARLEEMCFYNKKILPLMIVGDSIIIFNTLENLIEIYSCSGNLLSSKKMSFHQSRFWDKNFIQDKITGKIFTQFTKLGITSLCEINLKNGELEREIKIPQMNFVQKISVHNNRIYFLYNDNENHLYKQIFAMNYEI